MTTKEALKRFKQPIMLADMDWNKRVQTLETALDRLEELEEVLKIIKEKQVMFPIIITVIHCYGDEALKEYNRGIFQKRRITKTEFNLLKKYLL